MAKSVKIPLDSGEKRKRKRELFAAVIITLLLIVLTLAEFRLTRVSSTLPFVNSIFFFGLLNINIILLIALVWLIFRNVGKLFFERRSRLLGARLKTKLVTAFAAFSIVPTLVLFTISALYIHSSFDKWFSIKIQNTLEASLEITKIYYRNSERIGMHFAEHLADQLSKKIDFPLEFHSIPKSVEKYLVDQKNLLALNAVEIYTHPLGPRFLTQQHDEENLINTYPRLSVDLLDKAFANEKVTHIEHIENGDLVRCLVPIKKASSDVLAVVVVNSYIPVSLLNKVDEISSVFEDYKITNPLKYPIKTTYFVMLVMMTLVIIFVAIWLGLYMAREMTVPLEKLVKGAQAVGSGNLNVVIEKAGKDEIAVLIESFNKMTHDLKENTMRLSQTSEDLEKRKLQLEAVLANIGTGVVVVDPQGRVMTFNRAASQILSIVPEKLIEKHYSEVFSSEQTTPLSDLIHRTIEKKTSQNLNDPEVIQWTYNFEDKQKSLAAIATLLKEKSSLVGVVLVIDDITHLVKGQREMAWREVARRIAHEIKNPLTPIKLSAQRLKRRLGHYKGVEGNILNECTDTIIQHTDELKEMVNEFSNFARFPETSTSPSDVNTVIKELEALFSQAHPHIRFLVELEKCVPVFEFDRDQIKRVIMNLLDNAISAVEQSQDKKGGLIKIQSHFHEPLQIVAILIEDNGVGMTEDVKSRVFEPYFSTKKEGTGLGLAIVKRIINDHDGFIRVKTVLGGGTQFLIELPTKSKTVEQKSNNGLKDQLT